MKAKCPVCGTATTVKNYYTEHVLSESYMACKHKHYSESYEYGHHEIYVDNQIFCFNYNNTDDERHAVQEKIKRAIQQYQLHHKGELMELWIGDVVDD